jgi:hypothetical protein
MGGTKTSSHKSKRALRRGGPGRHIKGYQAGVLDAIGDAHCSWIIGGPVGPADGPIPPEPDGAPLRTLVESPLGGLNGLGEDATEWIGLIGDIVQAILLRDEEIRT